MAIRVGIFSLHNRRNQRGDMSILMDWDRWAFGSMPVQYYGQGNEGCEHVFRRLCILHKIWGNSGSQASST
jgi:hypothetical protein